MSCLRSAALLSLLTFLSGCDAGSFDAPAVTGTEVRVTTDQMEVLFERTAPLDDTYMVFGGLAMNRPDAFSKVTLAGLAMADAQPIFDRFPDFHRCKSPGASLAQAVTRQMDIVPASAGVLACLEETLTQHEASLGAGGDRICVRLEGSVLRLASATAEGTDITSQLPPQLRHEYFLVESAELVDARSALAP